MKTSIIPELMELTMVIQIKYCMPAQARELFYSANQKTLGQVVRKPVNANSGLKVNQGNNFSCIKVFSIAYVLCSLRLLMLKTEGQKI